MAVDVESLTTPEFLMMLAWEGNPPPDPAFDNIRMSPEDWRKMFPNAAVMPEETGKPNAADDSAAPEAEDGPPPAVGPQR